MMATNKSRPKWQPEHLHAMVEAAIRKHGVRDWPYKPAAVFNRLQHEVLPPEMRRNLSSDLAIMRLMPVLNAKLVEAGAPPMGISPSALRATSKALRAAVPEDANLRKRAPPGMGKQKRASRAKPKPAPLAPAQSALAGHAPTLGPTAPPGWRGPTVPPSAALARPPIEWQALAPSAAPLAAPSAALGPAVAPSVAPSVAPPWQAALGAALPGLRDALSTMLADVVTETVTKLVHRGEITGLLQGLLAAQAQAQPPVSPAPAPVVVSPPAATAAVTPAPAPVKPVPATATLANGVVMAPRPATRKTIVVVCGFMQGQQQQFVTAFPSLQLRFWYSPQPNRHLDQLKAKCAGADYVLFKRDATSHTAVEAAESVIGREGDDRKRVKLITGSASSMKTMLSTIEPTVPNEDLKLAVH